MINYLKAMYQVTHDAKLPPEALERTRDRRLKSVLISAYRCVPYYREQMQKVGYNPSLDYKGPDDLQKLPVITKDTIKTYGSKAFLKEGVNLKNCFIDVTSGSTGIPFKTYQSPIERSITINRWLRVLFINGYSIFHKVMAPVSPHRVKDGKNFVQHFGIMRRLAVDYVRHSIQELVDKFLWYKPQVLYGNRSHLDLMAIELKNRRIPVKGLKLLIATAEAIHDNSRRLYRDCFGIDVIESYGSVEMGTMAYETQKRDGLHLCEDLTYFEFLNEKNEPVDPGEPGRVVVTDLSKMLMPFIRYDHGDLVVFENKVSDNGYFSKRIKKIIGRDNEFVELSDGSRLSVHDINVVVNKYANIMQFRIIQIKEDNLRIQVASDIDYFLSIKEDLLDDLILLKKKVKVNLLFDVVRVDKIEVDETGKIRTFVSELN